MHTIVIITSAFIVIIGCVYFILFKRKKRRNKLSHLDNNQIAQWKKERRQNIDRINLDVQAMGDNLERAHDLWKSLSKIVHESRWIGKDNDKIKLAAELAALINQHKNNFRELQNIKQRIEKELINDSNI
jgi:hypothetical protein